MIYTFQDSSALRLSLVGGKALSLMQLSQAGFPIPAGIVLSTEFFAPWLTLVKRSEQFRTACQNPTEESCAACRQYAASLPFDRWQATAFRDAMKDFPGERFAVRSSSPEEDSAENSYAGMYETHLGTLRENVAKAVAFSFSSCFDYRVMSYKKQNHIGFDTTSNAVIIQRQLDAAVSGVAFSLNPRNNAFDEVCINASFGLGHAIVSGLVTPDTYVFDTAVQQITERRINTKEFTFELDNRGGLRPRPADDPDAPALEDAQIRELASLVRRCEEHAGHPVDTEWAYENGQLYLLQSRPITAWYPLYEELRTPPGAPRRFYIDSLLVNQGFGEPMSVLGLDLWAQMLRDRSEGLYSSPLNGTAPAIHGKQYYSVTALYKVLGPKRTEEFLSTFDSGIRRVFKHIDLKANPFPGHPEGLELRRKLRFYHFIHSAVTEIQSHSTNYNRLLGNYQEIAQQITDSADTMDPGLPFEQNLDLALDGIQQINTASPVLLAAVRVRRKLNHMFDGHKVYRELVALGYELAGNSNSAMAHLMFDMARCYEFKTLKSREQFIEKVTDGSMGKRFMELFDQFMKHYSFRGFQEIDIASPRIYEDIGLLYDKLITVETEDTKLRGIEKRRQDAFNHLALIARQNGFEKKFRDAAEEFSAIYGYTENPKQVTAYIMSKLHDVVMDIGSAWTEQGRLSKASDIFDLHMDEIIAGQNDPDFDLRKVRAENLRCRRPLAHQSEYPLVIDSRGKIYRPGPEFRDGDMVGDPIAPGTVIGPAKVMNHPGEKPLRRGEILVARTTEPSWAPLFIKAAGVITEIGGPLQHGSIIIREYGLPCVSGLTDATKIIRDGDMLEVNGDDGLVKILKT